jgi:hypothetical protein
MAAAATLLTRDRRHPTKPTLNATHPIFECRERRSRHRTSRHTGQQPANGVARHLGYARTGSGTSVPMNLAKASHDSEWGRSACCPPERKAPNLGDRRPRQAQHAPPDPAGMVVTATSYALARRSEVRACRSPRVPKQLADTALYIPRAPVHQALAQGSTDPGSRLGRSRGLRSRRRMPLLSG